MEWKSGKRILEMEMEVERSGMEEREREEDIGDEHGDGDG